MVVRADYAGLWADAEDVGKAIAAGIDLGGRPPERVGRETAAGRNLPGGTVRVERIGGALNLDETADFPLVEFAMFAVDYDQLRSLKAGLYQAMKAAIGQEFALGNGARAVVQVARKEDGPVRPPWSIEVTDVVRSIENWRLSYPPYFAD